VFQSTNPLGVHPKATVRYRSARSWHEGHSLTSHDTVHVWKHKWTTECLGPVHAQACGARPPSYSTVLALSRSIEAFPLWDPPSTDQGQNHPNYEARLIQRHLPRVTAQEMLLLLHRPFFALGMRCSPSVLQGADRTCAATSRDRVDPLASEYGGSVIAAYRSAHAIVSFLRYLTNHVRHPIDRVWFIWSNLFSAAVRFSVHSHAIRVDPPRRLHSAVSLFAARTFHSREMHTSNCRSRVTFSRGSRPRSVPKKSTLVKL
jgi:hypothetical protein